MCEKRNIGLIIILILFVSQPVLAAPGDTLRSIPSPFRCPQGLAYDGQYLWNVDRNSDMIYQVNPDNSSD